MGIPEVEKGVLKLVHPGRYVEIHTEPITAAEVMRKNPRHCVARPDVFKFPYIVVRPESVLYPGRVFYVVPNRTIYRLLKARGQPSSRQNQTTKNHDHGHRRHHHHHRDPKQTSPRKPWAGMTPKHQNHDRCLKKQFQYSTWDGASFEDEDSVGTQIQQSYYAEVKHKVSTMKRITYQVKHESPVGSEVESLESRSFHTKKAYHCESSRKVAEVAKRDNIKTGTESREQVKVLKSCLRKHDNDHKSMNLRVTFAFPITTRSGESPALQQNT